MARDQPRLASMAVATREPVKVDTGVNSHAMQHVDKIFGRHIAGGTFGIRTAAKPGHRRIELPYAQLQAGQGVRERLAVGVVKMT